MEALQRIKPYMAMTALQFGYSGMNILTKVSLQGGMNHYVLVVYRHAFATLSIAPFALILERKVRPKMTFRIFLEIFVLALLGPVIDQNFYYVGLNLTSPTFACAMTNILPAMTFVLAVIFRLVELHGIAWMEKVDIKKVKYQAKVVGTVVTVGGAMLMTLYKGPLLEMVWTKRSNSSQSDGPVRHGSPRDWLIGSFCIIIATSAWAGLFVLQAATLKRYTAQLSLTTLICFLGTLQAIVVTLVVEHKSASAWAIGWDMNLLTAAYSGIVSSSLAYYVQGLVMKKRGPVFAAAFSPLMMIIVAIMGSFILAEKIFLGSVLGGVLIVVGLYSVLWGKHMENKETREKEAMALPNGVKGTEVANGTQVDQVELDRVKANNKVTSPVDQTVVTHDITVSEGKAEEEHKA